MPAQRNRGGAPRGNLNAYKHGRTSRQRHRLLEIIAADPEARQLLLDITRAERRRRREAHRTGNRILDLLRALALQRQNNPEEPPGPDTPWPQ